ncbi:MAG: QcrA and Rieske domain-containing protein [Anaerolineales bacterium]
MADFTRRDFLKIGKSFLAVTGLAVIFGPIIAYFYPADLEEVPAEPVLVGQESELGEGESKTVRYGRYPAIVINTADGLRAYSAVCTHFACIVKWDPQRNEIACPCHDGFFSPNTGDVISGPPPKPLDPIQVEVIDGDIYIGSGS